MTNEHREGHLVDEKDIEAFYEGQAFGDDFIERSIETLSLTLKVVRAAQNIWIEPVNDQQWRFEYLKETLAPFSQADVRRSDAGTREGN